MDKRKSQHAVTLSALVYSCSFACCVFSLYYQADWQVFKAFERTEIV